jgi:hypothetical protein
MRANIEFFVDEGLRTLPDPFPIASSALPPTPAGLSLSDSGTDWAVTASSRPAATFGLWIVGVGMAGIAAFLWSAPPEARGGDKLVRTIFTVVAPVAMWAAMVSTWGVYAIERRGADLLVRHRFWIWSWTRRLAWDKLRRIRLRHDSGRRGSYVRTVELTADRKIRFGEALTNEQRAYIAIFLLQKAGTEDNESQS